MLAHGEVMGRSNRRTQFGALAAATCSLLATLALATGSLGADSQTAADWPQWGGPTHDFKVRAGSLESRWPVEGPPRLWSRPLGEGYSALAFADGTLFTAVRRGAEEVIVALDASSGKTRWEFPYPAAFPREMNLENGTGPHATPLVAGSVVIAVGTLATVHALDRATGRLVWRRELWGEFNGTFIDTGYLDAPRGFSSPRWTIPTYTPYSVTGSSAGFGPGV